MIGGSSRDRTDDPLHAIQVLSQLSYTPIIDACAKCIQHRLGKHRP